MILGSFYLRGSGTVLLRDKTLRGDRWQGRCSNTVSGKSCTKERKFYLNGITSHTAHPLDYTLSLCLTLEKKKKSFI